MYALTTIQPGEDTPITATLGPSMTYGAVHIGDTEYPGVDILCSEAEQFERISAACTEAANLVRWAKAGRPCTCGHLFADHDADGCFNGVGTSTRCGGCDAYVPVVGA